ncbi:putative Membrane-associated kinase regulator [Quillaja saponaria]|uniref:Membrane-associated kinase regulator n=1 Tax=Quillaja saponaria TaxID=32244 RepID=A0AAD7Q3H9_QUISA|nr:putative Membrane-associated kinase regulator [Quillaja saponaria]
MDVLNFLKFWRPTTLSPSNTTIPDFLVETDNEFDEEEDSFFDLELTAPGYDTKENNENDNHLEDKTIIKSKLEAKEVSYSVLAKKAGEYEISNSKKPTFSVSASEPISKRKILPIEPSFKPQSPIALLKSVPKFGIFMFKKPMSVGTKKTGKTESKKVFMGTQKQQSKVFSLKLKIEESQNSSKLTRDNSLRSNGSKPQNQNREDSKSERFSKDVIQKYLKLIKPLYVKVSRRYNDKIKFSEELSVASPTSSPAMSSVSSSKKEKHGIFPGGIRIGCKHLGKSKSASAATGVASPDNRRDDSLLQQHDGIQSAILHCKRSFNSSRDSSLSRFTTSSSPENSMDSMRKSFEAVPEARF